MLEDKTDHSILLSDLTDLTPLPVNTINAFLDDEVITNYPSIRRKSTRISSEDLSNR